MSINTIAALPVSPLPDVMLEPLVRMALLEDLGRAGDLTTDTIVPADVRDELRLVARQEGVLAGVDLARLAFSLMDGQLQFQLSCADGTLLKPGMEIARISGKSRAILTAEAKVSSALSWPKTTFFKSRSMFFSLLRSSLLTEAGGMRAIFAMMSSISPRLTIFLRLLAGRMRCAAPAGARRPVR